MTGKPFAEQKTENMTEQRLVLENRSSLDLDGVIDVISFDDTGALISTVNGILAVDGESLHVVKLDVGGGSISFEGKVNGLFFSDGRVKGKGKRSSR